MLTLGNNPGRENLKKYFYSDRPWMTLMFWIGICTIPAVGIGFFILFAWLVLKIVFMISGNKGDEKLYDDILNDDVEYLKKRSVETMGLIEEEFSLIDPIVGVSFASEDAVKVGAALTAEKKNVLKMIWEAIAGIPKAIIEFLRRLFGNKEYMSRTVFYEGADKRIRGSLVCVTVVLFTEQQILSYTCNFDIALGLILEENVREVFYRDVDSVNYGDEIAHIHREDGTFIRTPLTRMRLAVASGKDIEIASLGESDLLENQIMATKSLIRSKKESIA